MVCGTVSAHNHQLPTDRPTVLQKDHQERTGSIHLQRGARACDRGLAQDASGEVG